MLVKEFVKSMMCKEHFICVQENMGKNSSCFDFTQTKNICSNYTSLMERYGNKTMQTFCIEIVQSVLDQSKQYPMIKICI